MERGQAAVGRGRCAARAAGSTPPRQAGRSRGPAGPRAGKGRSCCGIGSRGFRGGRRPSLGDYVAGMGPTGRPRRPSVLVLAILYPPRVGSPDSFLFEPASSASGTLLKAQCFAGLVSDVFDPAIVQSPKMTGGEAIPLQTQWPPTSTGLPSRTPEVLLENALPSGSFSISISTLCHCRSASSYWLSTASPGVEPHALGCHATEEAQPQQVEPERDEGGELMFRRDHGLVLPSSGWISLGPGEERRVVTARRSHPERAAGADPT